MERKPMDFDRETLAMIASAVKSASNSEGIEAD